MKPQVEIYDTTLRDGSQGEGINFSVADKLRIAEKLDAFGVHYIEGGWPGSNPKDIEFFAQARKKRFKNARLAAFGSTRKKGVPVEQAAVPVRGNLDVLTADASLAAAEVWLARLDAGRDQVLATRLEDALRRWDHVVLDCGPSLSLLNQNALVFADGILVTVPLAQSLRHALEPSPDAALR